MALSGHASGSAVVGVTIAMTCLAGLAVFFRMFTRIKIIHEPGLDDGFIVAALMFSIATTVTMCLQVRYGMGRHMDTLTLQDGIHNQKAFYVSIWVYNLSMSFTKLSILMQYLRIFPQSKFRKACYGLIAIVSIYACWTFFSAVFACWPIAYFWNPSAYPNGHCINRFGVWFANAGINIATDIATGVLPLPVLKQLKLPKRQKVALMVVFALGGCTCVVSILRLQSLYVISRATDITWKNPLAAIWSSVEINTGILCSCLPTLKGAISRFFPHLLTSMRSSPSYGSAGRRSVPFNSQRSGPTPQPPLSHRSQASLEALGRSLTGKGEATFKSYVNSRTDGVSDEEIEFDDVQSRRRGDHGQIQVVTVVEQDVEKVGEPPLRSETNSIERLVRPTFYDDNNSN